MNRILLSTSLALVLSGTLALAQSATTPAPAPTENGYHHGYRHAHNPQQEAEFLSKKLNLTPDQTAKLEPILADRQQKMAALRSNTALAPEDRKQQMRAIHEESKQQLSTVLTPEQLQQMKSWKHDHSGRHGQRQQPQSAPQPLAPSGL